jgi:hypothetical protein
MNPDDPQYQLFLLLHGGLPETVDFIRVGRLPQEVQKALGWDACDVLVGRRDAQKIRHHRQHGMDGDRALFLPTVIAHGDYYQTRDRGTALQIEVVLHEQNRPKRTYFAVLSRTFDDTAIHLRTFYFTGEISRSKMKGSRRLRNTSKLKYFKD